MRAARAKRQRRPPGKRRLDVLATPVASEELDRRRVSYAQLIPCGNQLRRLRRFALGSRKLTHLSVKLTIGTWFSRSGSQPLYLQRG